MTNEEKKDIQEKCKAEIREALDKHGCRLEIAMLLMEDGNYPQIVIVCNND